MSVINWFVIKSRKQREADSRRYDKWAFPYGELQKQTVSEVLKLLLPEEAPQTAMAVYLIGREGYRGSYLADEEDARTEEEKRRDAWYALKKQLPGNHRKKLPRYLALILADAGIDENLHYPSPEALFQSAAELEADLEQLKNKKRRGFR